LVIGAVARISTWIVEALNERERKSSARIEAAQQRNLREPRRQAHGIRWV
jgi:hypothetical protein